MTRKSPAPVTRVQVPHCGGLTLLLAPDIPATLAAALVADSEALLAPLRPWGRFREPVWVATLETPATAGSALPTPCMQLAAFATLDRVTLVTAPEQVAEWAPLLLHELGHAQCFQRCTPPGCATPYLPTWFREGLAMRVANGRPDPRQRRQLADHPAFLQSAHADAAAIAADPSATYALAWHLFAAWHDRYGAVGLTALYAALRRGHAFASAFSRVCGVAADAFVAAWLRAVQEEARRG